jgi:hypothetical protein
MLLSNSKESPAFRRGESQAASIFLRSWRSTRLRLRIGRTACSRRNSISLFRDRRSRAASLAKRALRFAGIRINSRSWRLVICLDIMFPFAIDGQGGRSHSDNIVISPSEAKVIGRPECRLCATSNFRASVSCEPRTRLDSRNRSQTLYSWQSDPGFYHVCGMYR